MKDAKGHGSNKKGGAEMGPLSAAMATQMAQRAADAKPTLYAPASHQSGIRAVMDKVHGALMAGKWDAEEQDMGVSHLVNTNEAKARLAEFTKTRGPTGRSQERRLLTGLANQKQASKS